MLGVVGIVIAVIWSGVSRVRNVLASENKPTLMTYLNELGGYAILGVILLVCGFAALVEKLRPDIAQETDGFSPPSIQTGVEQHVFSDGQYVISMPSSWKRMPKNEQQPLDLYCVDQQSDLQLTGGSLPTADIATDDPATIVQLIVSKLRTGASAGLEASEPQRLQIDDRPAVRCRASGTFGSLNLTFDLWVIRDQDRWVEFRFWTPRSRFPQHEAKFSQIVSSLKRVR